MKHLKVIPAALLLCFSHASFAEETELETVVVTANRIARTVDDTQASVSVVSRQDIERSQARNIEDLLRGLPGVMISNNGGAGKQSSLFVRGTNSDHVLVLVDGIRIGSVTSGQAALQDIPVEQIERIELVRGPRSSLYGSEAIGGVVQIFTKKGAQAPVVTLSAGSRGTFSGRVSDGFGSQKAWFNASLASERTRGIDACQGNTRAGCYTVEPDRDGYRNTSLVLRAGGQPHKTLAIEAQVLEVRAHNDYDGSTSNEADVRQQVAGSSLRWTPSESLRSTLRMGQSIDDSENFKDGESSSRFKTRRNTLAWQTDFELSENHRLVGGLDWLQDAVLSTTEFERDKRRNTGAFLQYLGKFGASELQFAVRHDDNEQFGHHGTGSVSLGHAFTPVLRGFVSFGTAFKAPTFNQLYYPGYGSSSLKPEKSRTLEVGFSGHLGQHTQWQANLFDTRVSELIVTVGSWPNSSLQNASKARIRGAEFSASTRWQDSVLGLNLGFADPRDQSGGVNDGKLLPRRPRQTARLDFDQTLGQFGFGASLTGVGGRYDDAANRNRLGGYGLLDLRAEYRVAPAWKLQLRLENALDKRYETAAYFNQPGFGAFLSLRYQPKD